MSTEKQRFYQSHIEAAAERGQALTEYAREHGLKVQALYGERRRQRREERNNLPGFVRVADISREPVPMSMLQVRLPNGVSVALPTDQVPLAEVLRTLAQL